MRLAPSFFTISDYGKLSLAPFFSFPQGAKVDKLEIDSYHWLLSFSGPTMDTARLFKSGRSQAVRLPKEYRFAGTEVVVQHFGNGVLLLPADDPWQTLQAGLAAFEPGFVLTRQQPDEQIRADISP